MRRAQTFARAAALAFVVALSSFPHPPAGAGAVETGEVRINFSHAGYGGGALRVPSVPDVLRVRPTGGDDTALIQAALDRVASMPADAQGLRGAVLLERGRFRVSGSLRLRASGVVLRGRGARLTTVVAAGRSRRTLVEVRGDEPPTAGAALRVTDEKAAAGARVLTLEGVGGLAVGDRGFV